MSDAAVAGAGQPVGQGRRVGKVRHPWGAWALSLITVGIYYLYWWYKINEEVKEYDPSIEVTPIMSLLAMFVPICNIVTLVRTGSRIGKAEESGGIGSKCSGGLGFLLALLFSTNVVYYQAELNKIWAQHGNLEPGTVV